MAASRTKFIALAARPLTVDSPAAKNTAASAPAKSSTPVLAARNGESSDGTNASATTGRIATRQLATKLALNWDRTTFSTVMRRF
jgi:hypothetical protein